MAGSESKQKALEKIDEFVNEDNKIVIYKWLSQTLSIHVDTAKYYLHCFVEENKSKYPINCCYLLSGIQEKADNIKVHKVVVTSQDKLEDTKLLFSSITSFHVYSVQLSKIQDSSVLYAAEVVSNRNLGNQQEYSAVKCDNVRIIPKSQQFEAKTSNEVRTVKKDKKEQVKVQPQASKQKQNGLFSLWQKQQPKPTKMAKKETETRSLKLSVNDNTKVKGTKQLPSQENNVETREYSTKKEDFKTTKSTVKGKERKTEGRLTSKLSKQRRKQDQEHIISSEDEAGKPTNKKRHKRIIQISESESESEDDLFGEDIDLQSKRLKICEESLEESPLEENDESPIPPTDNSTVSYKTVNKTYVDEHGFMVTKKIKECVRENDKKKEKLPTQETNSVTTMQNENTNPVQKKQASLMNFFMKK